jgi:hypothetical protein
MMLKLRMNFGSISAQTGVQKGVANLLEFRPTEKSGASQGGDETVAEIPKSQTDCHGWTNLSAFRFTQSLGEHRMVAQWNGIGRALRARIRSPGKSSGRLKGNLHTLRIEESASFAWFEANPFDLC